MIIAADSWASIGRFSDVVSVLGSLFALLAWLNTKRLGRTIKRERERLNQKVTTVLKSENGAIRLPITLRRGDVTRAEVLGLVGMLPMKVHVKGERYSIAYLSDPQFSVELLRVQKSEGETEFLIQCTPEELNQFDVRISATDRDYHSAYSGTTIT